MNRKLFAILALLLVACTGRADIIAQSTTYNRSVYLYQTGSAAGLTGAILAITASKNGAAPALITPTVTEIGNGWYSIAYTTTITNVLGPLNLYITATGADPTVTADEIVVPNLLTASTGGLPTLGTGSGQINPDGSGNVYVSSGTGANQINLSSGSVKVGSMASNVIGCGQLSQNLAAILLNGYLVSTGTTTPATADYWYSAGLYNNIRYWASAATGLYTWYNGSVWVISSTVGSDGSAYWLGGANVTSAYTAEGTATGATSFVVHGNAMLTAFQGDFTFPTNFGSTNIDGSGRVLLQPSQPSVTIPTVTALTNAVTGVSGVTFPATVPSLSQILGGFLFDGSGYVKSDNQANVTVGAYASGQNPANYILTTPANTLASDISGRVLLQPTQTGVTIPTVTTVGSITNPVATTGNVLTTADIAGVWNALTSGMTTNGSIGSLLSTDINATISSRPTAAAIAAAILLNPANLLLTNATGQVDLDLTQATNTGNTGDTVGGSLVAARAQGFGKWVISGTTLTIYAADNATVVKTFTISPTPTASSRQ